jgi:hypothetical protein
MQRQLREARGDVAADEALNGAELHWMRSSSIGTLRMFAGI